MVFAHEGGDAADGDAAVGALGALGLDLEILLTVALGHEVFGRHPEDAGQDFGDRLGAAIREREVVDVGAHGVGVAFDQEHFAGMPVDDPVQDLGDTFKLGKLVVGDFP